MKILLTEWFRDWRGAEPQLLKPGALSLADDKILFALTVSLGNGDYDEACIETDSERAKECILGLLQGPGNAKRSAHVSVETYRLFRPGYDVYVQGQNSYFFLNPFSRPELFDDQANLQSYVAGFTAGV
jgi:hypothetical protein